VLNFKSVTMEQAELETNPPRDKFLIVYFIILIHGMGTLMPWNMFITAKDYFELYKLSENYTHSDTTYYVSHFMQFMTIFSQLPNLIFNWLNIFMNFGGSLTTRIMYSIIIEVLVFIATEVLVLVDSSEWPDIFFWTTMGSVLILNVVNGIYQNTVYGIAARLPPRYTGAVILGSNLSGIFTAVISILSSAIAPAPRIAACYYFIVALLILFICFDSYFTLPLTKFYKYHDLQFKKAAEKSRAIARDANVSVKVPYWRIFKSCSMQCFNVFYIFFITLSVFPVVHSQIKPSATDLFFPEKFYSQVMCFLTFSVFATIGNLFASVITWPGPKKLYIPVLLRTVFLPLFFFCNYQPATGRVVPYYIDHDYVYWGIAVVFALTSGYYSSLAMMYCGKTVAPEYSSTAGMFGAASLVTGIFAGIVSAFAWPHVANISL
jgi:equilibrative nucleoside transporter 1/2/3